MQKHRLGTSRLEIFSCGIVAVIAMTLSMTTFAQSAKTQRAGTQSAGTQSARERLIGAWHLVRIDASGPDGKPAPGPQPKGMLIYTRDGHMSVQLMYAPGPLSNEYVLNGYEASFGSYSVDEAAHTVTHHVEGSITRDQLVGKDLPRRFEFTPDGHLIIRSTRPDEHWAVTWAHD